MNFAFDLRPALVRPTGVGAYVAALAERLPRLAPEDRFIFFSSSLRDRYPARDWPPNVRLVDRRYPARLIGLLWARLGWPPLSLLTGIAADVVHSPSPLIVPGGRGARHVVTVHDLFFLEHPDDTEGEIRRDFVALAPRHVRRADGVICVSKHTAQQVSRLLGVEESRLRVIPEGVDPRYRHAPPATAVRDTLARFGLSPGFILFVGSGEKRKNLPRLLAAHAVLRQRGSTPPPLVLAGPSPRELPNDEAVRTLGYVSDADKRALLASAGLLVLVSLQEGFGLPLLEAMAARVPVVCSGGSALEEIAGGAAVVVDPLDPRSIADGIALVLGRPTEAEARRTAGVARSMLFDWDATARSTLEYLRLVAHGGTA